MIAQAAGSLLHVRFQVIERTGVLGVAGARQLRQVADQRPAVARMKRGSFSARPA